MRKVDRAKCIEEFIYFIDSIQNQLTPAIEPQTLKIYLKDGSVLQFKVSLDKISRPKPQLGLVKKSSSAMKECKL